MAAVEISDLVVMLTARIDALCADVLPLGRREGAEWVDAKVAQGGLGDSMRVRLVGGRAGVWKHFATSGAQGDALELISYVKFNGDKGKAIEYAKAWLGVSSADPKAFKEQRRKAQVKAKENEAAAALEAENKRRSAQAIWHNASQNLGGSPVHLYLMGRGIGLGELPKPPGAIRFHPNLKHPTGGFYPAMVAQINNPDGEFIAVHRTFLASPAPDVFTKAPGVEAKLTLGKWAGGFISLNRGASNKSLKNAPAGDAVLLCEGIEDGLSLVMACPDMRVLSCINVGNFKNINLPKAIDTVVICADNDAPGSQAAKAVQDAIDRFLAEGRAVSVARSPAGKDFNDCLQAREGAA